MTPAMRIIRRVLFLPIIEAEQRERDLRKSTSDLGEARGMLRDAKSRMQARSNDLREAYDELLGKME